MWMNSMFSMCFKTKQTGGPSRRILVGMKHILKNTGKRTSINASDFVKGVLRTEKSDYSPVVSRLSRTDNVRLLHGAMIASKESGELVDQMYRHIYYGANLDHVNLIEELGDIMFGIGLMADELNVSIEQIMGANNAKLRARYPDGFSKDKALNRDLNTERSVLEGSKCP